MLEKRCETLNDEKAQRTRLSEWHENLNQRIIAGDSHHLKRHMITRQLNLQQTDTTIIKEWIRGVLKMEKKTKQCTHQDIRNFFNSRNTITVNSRKYK